MSQFPSFELHLDVWLIAAVWSWFYWLGFVRVGARLGRSGPNRVQLGSHVCAIITFIVGSIWPVHDVSEKSLYLVHMSQHLAFMNLLSLFIVMSLPSWLARWLFVRKHILPIIRFCTRFLPATILFNVLIVFFHWPFIVTLTVNNGFIHFLAHFLMVISFVVIWMVIVSPAPEVRKYSPIVQILYLFLQSILPTLPASFLTFGSAPLYKVYIKLPKLYSLSALEDQRIAGLIMKLGGGLLAWAVMAVIFFQWSSSESSREIRFRKSNANKLEST